MENDNLLINDGEAFSPSAEPSKQVIEREEEITRTLAGIPRLQDEIQRLDEKIAFYQTIDAIDDAVMGDPVLFMNTVAANKIVVQILDGERTEILAKIEDVVNHRS